MDRPYRLLLVDDEEGIRKVLNITLSHAGFKVFLAPDGEQGLAMFRAEHPDIVITDIKMPGIDGIELLRRVKQESPETEVIMITGHGDMDLAVKSLQHEAADFITKPIDSQELETSVNKAVDRIAINTRIQSYMGGLEEMIREKDRRIDEAQDLMTIGQTVAGMSHVIKNIAGGLKGSSFILEQGIESDNREYLVKGWEMMKGNIDKITNLSLDLLNYAKTSRPRLEKSDPDQPAREVRRLVSQKARELSVDLSWSFMNQGLSVSMDLTAVTNALFNLVNNAIDAVAEDIPNPNVRVQVDQHHDFVRYKIQDNGPGLAPGVEQAVFREFITTKGTRGTGFGLMTTKRIVDAHQGRIAFESRPGQGTEFTMELPLGDTDG